MRYKTRDIGDEGLDIRVPVTAAWLADECPGLDATPAGDGLVLSGRIDKSGDDYLLRGDLRGTLEAPCARCLEPARIDVDVPVTVSYVEKDEREEDDDADEDDGEVFSFTGGVIDLGPEIHDEILLALPIGPLCRPECAGICPVCGGNRNAKPCDCEEQQRVAQSKLSALKNVKI
jgi:uncharacterized protein